MAAYSQTTIESFTRVTTATLTTVLLKMGVKNVWIRGSFPLTQQQPRVAGPAFTMRFIPVREDLATPQSWSSPTSSRAAIEVMPEGCIAVVAADGCTDAGILGDILCQRMKCRNVAALISDGVMRDVAGVLQTGLGVWANGVAAPAAIAALTFANWQEPVGCGGVAIFPDDLIVADTDGAVVVPRALVDTVLERALAQEILEEWILGEVRNGAALPGLYPINDVNMHRFEAARSATKNRAAAKDRSGGTGNL